MEALTRKKILFTLFCCLQIAFLIIFVVFNVYAFPLRNLYYGQIIEMAFPVLGIVVAWISRAEHYTIECRSNPKTSHRVLHSLFVVYASWSLLSCAVHIFVILVRFGQTPINLATDATSRGFLGNPLSPDSLYGKVDLGVEITLVVLLFVGFFVGLFWALKISPKLPKFSGFA